MHPCTLFTLNNNILENKKTIYIYIYIYIMHMHLLDIYNIILFVYNMGTGLCTYMQLVEPQSDDNQMVDSLK